MLLQRCTHFVFALLPLSASAKCGNVDYSWGADALAGMHDYVVTMMLVDMFLLMFLLIGINVSDLFALTKENIVRGRLEYDRAKTGRHYSILLHPEALRIIEKYKGENKLLRFSEHFRNVDVATVMINKKLAKVRPGLTTYYARHTWASIAFNIGIQKDVVSLALGHSFGVRVTDTYINADLSRVDEANRRVIDYVLYNKK